MEEGRLEEIIQAVEKFCQGVSLAKLLDENPNWDKKTLQKRLKELSVKNKIVSKGNGQKKRYFIVNSSKLQSYSNIFSYFCNRNRPFRFIYPLTGPSKWGAFTESFFIKEHEVIEGCARSIFQKRMNQIEKKGLKEDIYFSLRTSARNKERAELEKYKILNQKVEMAVLNI